MSEIWTVSTQEQKSSTVMSRLGAWLRRFTARGKEDRYTATVDPQTMAKKLGRPVVDMVVRPEVSADDQARLHATPGNGLRGDRGFRIAQTEGGATRVELGLTGIGRVAVLETARSALAVLNGVREAGALAVAPTVRLSA